MTTNPDRTDSPTAATPDAPAGQGPARPVPPAAGRVRHERTHHGDTVVDEYAWLAGKDNPETIAYLEAENAFTAAMTASQAGLRETIFGEIKGRTKETDLSVPARKGDWWYYTRTVEGKQYPLNCRHAALPGQAAPPPVGEDGPLPGEEILLDCNELAGDAVFFSLGAFSVTARAVSPWLAAATPPRPFAPSALPTRPSATSPPAAGPAWNSLRAKRCRDLWPWSANRTVCCCAALRGWSRRAARHAARPTRTARHSAGGDDF